MVLHRHGAGWGGGSWSSSSLQDRTGAGGDPGSGSAAELGPVAIAGGLAPPPLLDPGKDPMEYREGLQGDGPVGDVLVAEG